jgi:Coenzyme PQQ synthesis protein D (PqqD)
MSVTGNGTETKCYCRTSQAEWSVGPDGQITVKDSSSGWYFPLNGVATLIWDMLDGANSAEEITAAVVDEFDVDEETARTDVHEFIEQARDLNLVE